MRSRSLRRVGDVSERRRARESYGESDGCKEGDGGGTRGGVQRY